MRVRVELGDLAIEIDSEKDDITAELLSKLVKPFQDADESATVDAVAIQRVGFTADDEGDDDE